MSMRKLYKHSVVFAAIVMNNGIWPTKEERKITKQALSKKEKKKIARHYAITLHEFTIKRVKIIALNKKTELKIYRNKLKKIGLWQVF